MYVVVLARTPQEGYTYAKRAKLPRGRFRVASRAGSIKGLRVAEIHELPSYARRVDRHAIEAVLRYTRGERIKVEMPELDLRVSEEEAWQIVEDEANGKADELIERVANEAEAVAKAMVEHVLTSVDSTTAQRIIEVRLETEGLEEYIPEGLRLDPLPEPTEEPDGEEAGATEPSEEPAPAPKKPRNKGRGKSAAEERELW